MNLAAIDIGSNTLLLLIVNARGETVADHCRFGRLGRGLDASGQLDPGSIACSLEICHDYRRLLDEHGVRAPVAVATQALREAGNAAAFLAPAEQILGAPIDVIAGTREAALSFLSVARTFPELSGAPYAVIDVGGGSTEIITSDGVEVTSVVSIPIGAVRMTERHLRHDPATPSEIRSLRADILRSLAAQPLPRGVPIVATAGTATTIAAVALGRHAPPDALVTGLRITPDAVEAQLARLLAATVAERRAIPGVHPDRAELIAGGVAIYACALEHLAAPVLIACDRGVRWGLAFEQLAHRPASHAAAAAASSR